jgi:hypothetical protein
MMSGPGVPVSKIFAPLRTAERTASGGQFPQSAKTLNKPLTPESAGSGPRTNPDVKERRRAAVNRIEALSAPAEKTFRARMICRYLR